ncbi:MAG: glycosyltransferase family 4 protein [Chloroflexi bacterium]|nr:glycosyltransferase family 4 protein [Chloroflexota bacterium]
MRVVLATHFFFPTQSGGTESYTLGLARALRARGHEPFVICAGSLDAAHGWPPRAEDDTYDGIPVRRLSWDWVRAPHPFRTFYDNPEATALFSAYLREVGADVVHVTSCYSLSANILGAARQAGCRTILTLTDFWFLCIRHTLLRGDGSLCAGPTSAADCQRCLASGSPSLRGIMDRTNPQLVARALLAASHAPALVRLPGLRGYVGDAETRLDHLRQAFAQADAVIAPSRFLKQMLVRGGYSADSMTVSPYGMDLSWGPMTARRADDGQLVLGYLGQIEPLKGVDVAVRAVRALPTDRPVRLRIFGSLEKNPSYVARLRELAEGDARIEFVGPYQPRDLREVLAGLDAIVVPSLWYENTPLVISEAFAARRPALATNLGGMSEAVQHGKNGLLFERGDAAGLAAAIVRLTTEPGLLDELRAGIQPVRTIDEEIVALLDLYRGATLPVSA